jgi:DNA-binding Lrp family transcriptional regulator|tara:strand:- start:333 stop:596 length:264 start_codon:yes stop_codon:yes gene_type:complete
VPIAFVLINSDLGTDESIISKIKEILNDEKDIEFTTQGVYGIYDIVLKISSDNTDILRNIITYKIRKINSVQSTLTMMVVEEQEKSD